MFRWLVELILHEILHTQVIIYIYVGHNGCILSGGSIFSHAVAVQISMEYSIACIRYGFDTL